MTTLDPDPQRVRPATSSDFYEAASPSILVVTRHFFPEEGGIEEYAYNRCLQDPSRVIVLASSCPGDLDFDKTQPFPIYRWPTPVWLKGNQLGTLLKQIVSLPCLLTVALRLYSRYRYQCIELAHGYDFPILLLLGFLLPVRCFLYLHGHDLLCTQKNSFLRGIFSWGMPRIEGIICNSRFTRDNLQAHIPQLPFTQVINPRVRPEKFGRAVRERDWNRLRKKVRRQHGISDTAIAILTVGRLIRRKGFDRIIKLLPRLLADGIDAHYLICGRGEQQQALQSLVRETAISERVHFAGYVPDPDLGAYYAACDIFAMLSYFDSLSASIEGFGIVYLEAGLFGKPVLASDVGGVRDAVRNNQNGLLVRPDDSEAALRALRRLCRDAALRQRLGAEGRILATRQSRFYGS